MIWLLHGAVGMAADWKHIATELTHQGQTVRSVDLWRYLDCCPMSMTEFARAFCEEVKRVDASPTLVGYSMGGRLALHALLQEPDLWQKAVIISGHPGLQREEEKSVRRVADAEWAAQVLKGDWKKFLHDWNEQSVLSGGESPSRRGLEIRRSAVARSFVDWSLGQQNDLRSKLSQISCPVSWLVGRDDAKFLRLAKEIENDFSACELSVVEQCGHRIPWSHPDVVVDAILQKRVGRKGSS